MLDLNQLYQLVIISEEGTISKAAEVLNISQPALTRSIQKLENELGLKLFARTKNKITLNDTGKEAVKKAKQLLKQVDHMIDYLTDYDLSHRSIYYGTCAPAPTWILKDLFNKHYHEPIIQYDIDDHEEHMIDLLNQDVYSFIVLTHPIDGYYNKELLEENLYLSVPNHHKFAHLKEISFSQINGTSVLMRSKLGYWYRIKEELIPDSKLIVQDDLAILEELIKESSLPSFKTDVSLKMLNETDDRKHIPIIDQQAHVTFYFICKKEKRDLIKIVKENS